MHKGSGVQPRLASLSLLPAAVDPFSARDIGAARLGDVWPAALPCYLS